MCLTPRSPRCRSVRRMTDSTKKTWLMPVPANALASHSAPFICPASAIPSPPAQPLPLATRVAADRRVPSMRAVRKGRCLCSSALSRAASRLRLRLAGGDGCLAVEQDLGAFDDRHVDHLAVDGDGADAFGERLVIGLDHPAGVIGLGRAGPEFLVEDLDLARVYDAGAHEAEPARAPDGFAEAVKIAEIGPGPDKAERHNAGAARREDAHLLRHEQPLGLGQHPGREREILRPE